MIEASDRLTFSLSDVRASLAPEVYARGEAYARAGRVNGLKFSNSGNTIVAHVRGTAREPYLVTVYVSRTRSQRTIVSGYCQCPVANDCKHVAATLVAALTMPDEPLAAPASRIANNVRALLPPVRPATGTNGDANVDLWLSGVRETLATATADSETAAGDERIAYVFRDKAKPAAPLSRVFPVESIVVRRTKTQRWTKLRDATAETLAAGTARALAPDDALVGRFLQVYERTEHGRLELAEEIVRRIIATGRAHVDRPDSPSLTLGAPRMARLAWTLASDGTQRPALEFEAPHTVALPGPAPWYVDLESFAAGPIDAGLPGATLAALLRAPALDPAQAKRVREKFADAGTGLALPPPLEVSERTIRTKPLPVLKLRSAIVPALPSPHWRSAPTPPQTLDFAELSFAYGPLTIDPTSRADEIRHIAGAESLRYERSRRAETQATQRLHSYGLYNDLDLRKVVDTAGDCMRMDAAYDVHWPVFAHRHVAQLRADGWQVEIDASFRHRVIDLSDDETWQTRVEEHADGWFDVAIGLDVDGRRVDLLPILRDVMQRSDPAVIEALGADEFYYVTFADVGKTIAIPAQRLKAILGTLVELHDPDALRADGALRLPRVRAAVVNELEAASGLRWDVPERLRTLGDQLRAFTGVARVDVPSSFRGELRPYQRDGLDWLQFLSAFGFGGILADDMGLGKSVQTLAHLLCEKEAGRLRQPALLVVPTSLVHNWCDEAARFAPALGVLPLHGPARAEHFGEIAGHDLVITTYALLVRDAVFRERSWHAVILDEAQTLKNPQAKVAQVAMGLRAAHRLCLTGTPVENHLGDLWSLFSIALPGALGDRKQFGRVFRTPIEKRGDTSRNRALAARIAPFLLRRTKESVATELPEKTVIVQRVELVGAQRDLYETVRLAMHRRVQKEIEQRGLARSQIIILDALLKLRQVCCDPRLLPKPLQKNAQSVKLELLLEMLPQMIEEGRRILLFSQFTSMLDLIGPELEARGIPFAILTGQTQDRASVVKRFQTKEVPLFLISLKAGGTGLNLTAADTVIHYDPWWNPAVERQATDRAHRIGQTQHVFAYKLISAGTVEEKIVELQARKAQLAAAIFSDNAGSAARFAAEDVAQLFAPIEYHDDVV